MKYRILFVFVLLMLFAITASAQDADFATGGTIVTYDTSDPSVLNPLLGGDGTSSAVYGRMYPVLIGVNYFTGANEPGAPGSLATAWEYNEDGSELTITIRDDLTWSDGTPITAHDYVWGVSALRTGLLETQRGVEMWEALDDGTPGSGTVTDVVAVDDTTIHVTFSGANCQNINYLWPYVLPSHVFEADFGDDLAAMNEEPLYNPGVGYSAWVDVELVPGDRTSLAANPDFSDNSLSFVKPDGLVILNLADEDVALERFRAGELSIKGIPGPDQPEFEADPNYQTFRYDRLGYVFYAFNHANPDNPQAAYDEEGNYIEQEPHPVLGDKRVRQAIVYAVDMAAIIENNLGGAAVPVGIPSIPASWDWNPDLLYPFDPALASDLLDEAGWVDTDGNGVRECVSCAQMEIDPSYEGTEMSLVLNANEGGSEDSVNMIEFIAESLRNVGISTEVAYLDWGSAFLPELTGQTFDMAILAWGLSLPLDPDNMNIFGREVDVPGSGFNFGSFHSPEVEELYNNALDPSLTDGCSVEGRKQFYDQANAIIFDELPYMFMYANRRLTAVPITLQNWDPAPFSTTWQEDVWDTVSGAGG